MMWIAMACAAVSGFLLVVIIPLTYQSAKSKRIALLEAVVADGMEKVDQWKLTRAGATDSRSS